MKMYCIRKGGQDNYTRSKKDSLESFQLRGSRAGKQAGKQAGKMAGIVEEQAG